MSYWLLKTGPESFNYDELACAGEAAWTDAGEAESQANLRAMQPGDQAVIFHSGERRAVGLAEVSRADDRPSGVAGSRVHVRALSALPAPVPLQAMKLEPAFEGSALVRRTRLSVVPLSPAEWQELHVLAWIIARTGGARPQDRF
jgi:predicted RNA-binding protein with PUA-like domain